MTVYVLSFALLVAVTAAGVGWYRYFVLQAYIKTINEVLGRINA